MTSAPTHYRSQNGKVTKIADMVDEHLANAVAKRQRAGSMGHDAMLAGLVAEQQRRASRG